MGQTAGVDRTVLSLRARAPEVGMRGRRQEEMANAEEGGVEAEDVTMAESKVPRTTAMPSQSGTETAIAVVTSIPLKNGTAVGAPCL